MHLCRISPKLPGWRPRSLHPHLVPLFPHPTLANLISLFQNFILLLMLRLLPPVLPFSYASFSSLLNVYSSGSLSCWQVTCFRPMSILNFRSHYLIIVLSLRKCMSHPKTGSASYIISYISTTEHISWLVVGTLYMFVQMINYVHGYIIPLPSKVRACHNLPVLLCLLLLLSFLFPANLHSLSLCAFALTGFLSGRLFFF